MLDKNKQVELTVEKNKLLISFALKSLENLSRDEGFMTSRIAIMSYQYSAKHDNKEQLYDVHMSCIGSNMFNISIYSNRPTEKTKLDFN